jgi:NAD(P)-dependent dehydrogenase (short-subunit alcohol dehydrogenase family)
MFSLEGKTAIVTGAGSGMGASFAQTLAAAGAKVICGGRRLDKVEATAASIRADGGEAIAVSLDISDAASVQHVFDAAEEEFGLVDVLINAAGQIVFAPFPDFTDEDWANLVNVNFSGTMRMSREFAKRLIAAEHGGSIVTVTSVTGMQTMKNVAVYGSIKAGMNQLAKQIAVDMFDKNIRSNVIAPGYFATDMVDWYFETETGKAEVSQLPAKRVGRVEELSGALLLLASDAGSYINGAVLPVDYGQVIQLA